MLSEELVDDNMSKEKDDNVGQKAFLYVHKVVLKLQGPKLG